MRTRILKLTVAMSLIALATVACNKENTDPAPGDPQAIVLGSVAVTRAAPHDQIAAGQQIGLFIAEQTSGTPTTTYTQNLAYAADGSGALSGTTQYYPASGNGVTISAYHPYNAVWTSGAESYTFSVAADQSADAGYLASDLLYSAPANYARQSAAHNLSFDHLLARATYTLAAGSGSPELTGATVKFINTLPQTSVNLSTGVLSAASGTAVAITPHAAYGAVIVPQTIAAGTRLIEITLAAGGTLYYTVPAGGLSFTGGHSTAFNITVNLTGITLTTSVTDWSTGTPVNGNATVN